MASNVFYFEYTRPVYGVNDNCEDVCLNNSEGFECWGLIYTWNACFIFDVDPRTSGNSQSFEADMTDSAKLYKKCVHSCSDCNYCSCWGDPHCIDFQGAAVIPHSPPISFNSYVGGDHVLFSNSDLTIIQTQKQVSSVAFIIAL